MRGCPVCARTFDAPTEFCPEHRVELDPLVGAIAGRYRIGRRLGRGGMGAVYLGEHLDIGSRVALKFMESRHAQDRRLVDRFLREARAVNLIEHENVVRVTDHALTESGRPYLVMELLDGKPLASLVGKPQPLSLTGPILLQVAEGLQAAHERGIVHRDLKPDNVLLVTRNRRANVAKLIDFGIAKVQAASDITNTASGTMMGTWHYMSPEQVQGGEVGPASDIYAFGVMTYLLATGQFPFDGDAAKILVAHVTQPPPPPSAVVPDLPERLEALILSCLRKPPAERPASMGLVAEELGEILDALGLSREPPIAPKAPQHTPTPAPEVEQLPTRVGTGPTPAPTRFASGDSTPAGTVFLLPEASEGSVAAPPSVRSTQPWLVGGVVAALVLVGAAAVVVNALGRPSGPSAPATPSKVRIAIETVPSGAQAHVLQSGRLTEKPTPVALELAYGEPIELRVEAEGFEPQTRRFDGLHDVDVTLQLKPAGAPVVVTPPVPVAAPVADRQAPVAAAEPVKPVPAVRPAPRPATTTTTPAAPKPKPAAPTSPAEDSGGLMPMDFGAN